MIGFDEHTTKSNGINMTSMIDVVFLLLIFFLLTSIFSKPSIPLNLPEADTARVAAEPEVSVAIKKDGGILLNGQDMTAPELFVALTEVYKKSATKDLSLISDKEAPFGRAVEVMDMAKKAGAENISVIAERKR